MTLFFEKSSLYGWEERMVEVSSEEEAEAVLNAVKKDGDRIREGSVELY